VRHWKEKAAGRKTITFGATVAHAEAVRDAFLAGGVAAAVVHGEMSDGDRKATLAAFETGTTTVLVNVAVLTEGYDYTPTVLHRPAAPEFLQVDADPDGRTRAARRRSAEYPGVIKTDCIVLDFGTASLMHGSLEQEVDLDGFETGDQAPTKSCPECDAEIPASLAGMSLVRARLPTAEA
jgi:DNA repair protein RadD